MIFPERVTLFSATELIGGGLGHARQVEQDDGF